VAKESGWPMIANMLGVETLPIKPGSVGKAVCGYDIKIFNEEGNEVQANQQGYVVVKPHYLRTLLNLWKDNTRFRNGLFRTVSWLLFSGDGGYKDEDDYIYITGRVDDVINVAGHRLSTAEMEEVVALINL
jgi:propionyl-CoA synthetase